MMASNGPMKDWGKLIGDVPAATAIIDRFLLDAEMIQITVRSSRLSGKSADEKGGSSKPENGKFKSGKPANRLRHEKAEEIKRLTTPTTSKLAAVDPQLRGRF